MQSGDMREVLMADLAVERGLVSAEDAAAALEHYRKDRDCSVLSGLTPEDRVRIEGDLEGLLSAAGGDEQLALRQRGVGRDLSASLPPRASHELSEAGAAIRAPLRALSKKRYVGFLPLGQGGMGVVYLALDSELNRRVAFKMIRSGMSDPMGDDSGPVSDDMVARFLQEAIVTGGLEHPGIVPIYELGLAPSGVPYYTMRLVRGERTLGDAIAEATTLEDRLALIESFLKICDAVGYAHSRGVIHRDLKPANIALGQFGEVVVLDWGLAKMRTRPDLAGSRWQARLDELRETTDMRTLTSALGTPGYMAPEAALADVENIDERSDVYSLGAMLYRILTGEFPHPFKSLTEYIGNIMKGIDSVPGAPAGLGRIVAKALTAEREGRYASVGEFSSAIRAWQGESAIEREVDGLEVEAEAALRTADTLEGDALLRQLDRAMALAARIADLRPQHEGARALREQARESRSRAIEARERATRSRLLRRVGVVGLMAATAATIFVALLINSKRHEAEAARVRAESERARAEDLAGFMLNDLFGGLETLGRLDLLGSVARKTDDYYRGLPGANLNDEERGARALTLARVGEILLDSGAIEEALLACRESQEMFESLVQRDPQKEEWRYQLSVALNRTGDVQQEAGAIDEALATYRRALEIRRGLDRPEPLAGSIERVADVLMRKGERERARTMYREALWIRQALIRSEPDNPDNQLGLALSLEREGDFVLKTEGAKAALGRYQQSLALRQGLLRAQPSIPGREGDLASCLFRIGHIQQVLGERAASIRTFDEVLGIYRQLVLRDPSNASWRRNLALGLERVGHRQRDAGDPAAARKSFEEALDIHREIAQRDAANTRARHDVVTALMDLGDIDKTSGDYSGAFPRYDEALRTARALVEEDRANTEWQDDLHGALVRIGQVYQATQRPEEARTALVESLAVARRLVERDTANIEWQLDVAYSLDRLGELAAAQEKAEEAEEHLRASADIRRKVVEIDSQNVTAQGDLAWVLDRLGGVLWGKKDYRAALGVYRESLALHRGLPNKNAQQLRNLAVCLYNIGILEETFDAIEEARAVLREGESIHVRLPAHAAEHHLWKTALVRLLGRAGVETPYDELTMGYWRFEESKFDESTRHFENALRDASIREDLARGNQYNAACAAARAGNAKLALQWLAEDLRLRRANTTPEQFAAHWDHACNKDPDLVSLRALPEFQTLMAERK